MKELQKAAKAAEKDLQQLHTLSVTKKTECDAVSAEIQELSSRLEQEEKKLEAARNYLEEFQGLSIQKAYQKLEEINGRYQSLEGLIAEKEKNAQQLQEEIERERNEVQEHIKELNLQIKEYGFSDREQYERSHRTPEKQKAMEKELRSYQEETRFVKDLIEQLKKDIGKKEFQELSPLKDKRHELESTKEKLLCEQKKWTVLLDAIKRTLDSLRENLTELKTVSEEYGFVKDLDNIANGVNPKKLVFEQYVLASYFEEILRAANLRLFKMTSGRFEMSRLKQVGDGRSRDNLEIQVMDYYTGKYRSVKTLSGGESFKASLSLALGMSDVIQAFHGGIRVDTLFVDEGFGTLDAESLDQACEILSSLVESDRLIGIISHVPELRERIDSQLVVEKTSGGSTIKIMV